MPAPSASTSPPHDGPTIPSPAESTRIRDAIFANQQIWLDRLATGLPYPRQSPGPSSPIAQERLWHGGPLEAARTGRSAVIMAAYVPAAPISARTLDQGFAWLRTRRTGDVLVWAAAPMPDLDILLLARGARESFVPHWMWRPLAPAVRVDIPAQVTIRLATPADRDEILANPAIPYLDGAQLATMLALGATPAGNGPTIRVIIAREGGPLRRSRVVGLGALNVDASGPAITANLFNLGVDPAARGRGIGTALTQAALALARDDGAIGLGLNATPDGERIYRAAGFHSIGQGRTWFLPGARLRHPPDDATIAFAEALARGDDVALDSRLADMPMMPNGESPVVFAARFGANGRAAETVRWLLRHGAMPDIVALWTVGLRDEATALMTDPRLRDRRAGPNATTPLHDAIERDDLALAHALIAAGANRTIRDIQYQGTAADWARVLHRQAIAALLVAADTDGRMS